MDRLDTRCSAGTNLLSAHCANAHHFAPSVFASSVIVWDFDIPQTKQSAMRYPRCARATILTLNFIVLNENSYI